MTGAQLVLNYHLITVHIPGPDVKTLLNNKSVLPSFTKYVLQNFSAYSIPFHTIRVKNCECPYKNVDNIHSCFFTHIHVDIGTQLYIEILLLNWRVRMLVRATVSWVGSLLAGMYMLSGKLSCNMSLLILNLNLKAPCSEFQNFTFKASKKTLSKGSRKKVIF